MNIGSISIVVPTKRCVNACKFCVSRMHDNPYEDSFNEIAYRKRIKYAANNGVNSLILTGTGEALQNTVFLEKLLDVLNKEHHPFPNVELQTSGVLLVNTTKGVNVEYQNKVTAYWNVKLLKDLGVNTISLSVSDIFDSENNWNINGTPEKLRVDLDELCRFIKVEGFNLRLSLNMTKVYNKKSSEEIFNRCKELGADQITIRKLYTSSSENEQNIWIKNNKAKDRVIERLDFFIAGGTACDESPIHGEGTPLYRLPFGAMVYSYDGMSIAVDDNCMSKNENEKLKYVILRENGKLYAQWDDEGSLIF